MTSSRSPNYLDRRPERFYSRPAADALGDMLSTMWSDEPDLLVQFFNVDHERLKIAFRSMDDINRLPLQDATVGEIAANELALLTALDLIIHPAYLRLTEAVLGLAILPVARHERRKRQKDEGALKLQARIEEVRRGPLARFMTPFDRVVRNAIAHGTVAFRDNTIAYQDLTDMVEHSAVSALRLFDQAIDVCNGFLLAYQLFFLEAAEFMTQHGVTPPLPLIVREVQAQGDSDIWRVVGGIETKFLDGDRGLRLLADAKTDDQRTVYEAIAGTGALAHRLAPQFDAYEISVQAFGMPKGVGVARRSAKLREARLRNVTDPLAIATFSEMNILVWEKIIEQAAEVAPDADGGGSFRIRHARLVRKADWLQLNADVILDTDDREVAKAFVRERARQVIAAAAEQVIAAAAEQVIAAAAEQVRGGAAAAELRTLPIGAAYIMFFLRDARRRDLQGVGTNTLCRVVERSVGPIADWPLHKSIVETDGRMRIEWNTAARTDGEQE